MSSTCPFCTAISPHQLDSDGLNSLILWNIVDILAFGAFVLRSISLSFRWRCYSFACDDIFDYLDAFFLSVNQCILTSNSTWKHFGDYSGTCGECTWLHLLTIA